MLKKFIVFACAASIFLSSLVFGSDMTFGAATDLKTRLMSLTSLSNGILKFEKIYHFCHSSVYSPSSPVFGNDIGNKNQNRPTIFLNFNGVLNNYNSDNSKLYIVEPENLIIVKYIVDATNAEIVLCTTCVYSQECLEFLKKAFNEHEIPLWIDTTLPKSDVDKADEILAFLNEKRGGKIKNFVIIDDLELEKFGENRAFIEGHFIHVNRHFGLTKKDAKKAIDILNK
jgi:HAD domain in Swiss Army Knife RNA repair proteins